jgi:hypothetical protein
VLHGDVWSRRMMAREGKIRINDGDLIKEGTIFITIFILREEHKNDITASACKF